MKTFKSLFYAGLMMVFIPLFFITVIVILPAIVTLNKKSKEVNQEKHVVIYDTVKVEKVIYDTVRPKKKVVKKKEEIFKEVVEINSDSTSN
jgi:hypothetical protein